MAFSVAADRGGYKAPLPGREFQSQSQRAARGFRGWRPGHEWQSQTQRQVPNTGPKPVKPVAKPAEQQQSPLDSTYYGNVGNETFRVNNQIGGLTEQQGFRTADLQSALGQMGRQKPLDELKTQESANRQGLLYSGHLGQAIGNLNENYLTRQSGLEQNYQRSSADSAARIAALKTGLDLFTKGQFAAAAQRASQAAQKSPSTGMPLPPAPEKGAWGGKAAPKPKAGPHPQSRGHEFGSQSQWLAHRGGGNRGNRSVQRAV